MHIRTLALTASAAAALGMATVATAAHAAEPTQQAEQSRHCVLNVAVDSLSCYDSFTEAIAKATGGRVTDAPDNSRATVTDPRLAAQLSPSSPKKDGASLASTADVVIGVEWADSDFEGSTLTYSAPSGCTGTITDIDWVAASVPSDWNDEIGSYQAFANCWAKHFEHINFSGISMAFDAGQADMGWMDDETSSIQWS